jgi:hypothetical protein
MVGIALWAT